MSYFSRTPTEKLSDYLSRIHSRLRVNAASRGFGATALVALLLTVICVYIANRFAFSDSSVLSARTLLFGSVIGIVIFALLRPLLKIGRRSAADHAEKRVPAFEGRVETFFDQTREESGEKPSPFLDLLAEDTMRVAEAAPVQHVVDAKRMLGYALAAAVAIGVLMWMGTSGPGYWGYGTARLWGGWLKPSVSPLYQIVVEPGDTTIRQGADLIIKAQMVGFESPTAQLFAKFDSSVQWEEAPMQREVEGTGFEFLFAGVREPLHYYIAAGGIQSEEFEVQVVEMPNVESIKLTYHYPSWTGLEDTVEEDLGDIRAVTGTEVEVEVKTDKPLTDGVLRVNEENSVSMSGDGLTSVGRLKVAEEGYYFVAALYQGEIVRLTNDYFITVVPDEEPTVRFLSPGRDAKATNIEEVFTQFEASDDFGLRAFEVHYSVNGSEVEKVRLPVNGKDSTATHTFYLEEMSAADWPDRPSGAEASDVPDRLQPGDIISYYGIARDAKTSTQTDMYFIEVRPFEYEFVQGQAGGGMGGGGQQQQEEISKRQREIIAGTWNLIKESDGADKRTRQEIRDNALLLSEVQLTLRDQARTLAERVRARQLAGTNEDFKAFVENMEKAAEQMAPAAEELKNQQLRDALSPEQKALQYLRRAESIFRRIQVAFGNRGGGGGGGQASRDLLEMFELEMDLEKNQYETGGGASSQQLEREIDEALEKLKELARRQEKLADQIRREPTPTFSQRWQQEILRREAEELKRRMEELQQRQSAQQQSGQQQSGQQSGQQQGGQQSGQQQRGQQSGQQAGMSGAGGSRLQQTIRRLEQAARDMERAAQAGGRPQDNLGQRQAQARSQRAQERLQEALQSLEEQRRQETSATLSDMAQRAERLAQEQEAASETLQKSLQHAIDYIKEHGGQARGRIPSGLSPREELGLSDQKKEMQQEVEAIERQMQQAARQLRNTETSRKLREALSDMRDAELGMRLRKEAAYIRQGYAYYAAQRQGAVTEAIKRLRDQLREAERLAQAEGGGEEQGLERTLASLEELRRRLEDAAGFGRRPDPNGPNQAGGQRGQQDREGPGGQNENGNRQGRGQGQQQAQQQGQGQGQQQGQGQGRQQARGQGQGRQPGQQPGPGQGRPNARGQFGPGGQQRGPVAGGGGGPHGWRGGQQDWGSASNFGGWRGPAGTRNLDPETRRRMEQAMRESGRAVPGLTRQLRGHGFSDEELAEIRRFVSGLSNENFPGNPNLLQEEHRKLLSLLEQLELQVRRQVEEDQGGTQVRATATEPVPEQYREAVAEYFRRLSQGR